MTSHGGRRVLVLAYYFPPLGGAGVQRSVKFVKYLPAFGWQPTVVTTASEAYPARDASLARDVPDDVRVVRAREIPGASLPARIFERLGLTTLSGLAAWPDSAIGWWPGAYRAALDVIRDQRPAAIYSTSAPYTAHLVARAVQQKTGLPWVADFRDEWAANPHSTSSPRVLSALARHAERHLASHADRVVVAADYFRILGASADQTVVIPNGVDETDLLSDGASPPTDRFRLVFVGTLYAEQDCAPVFEALERLLRRGAIDAERFEFRIVGNNWLPAQKQPRLAVQSTGYVPHGAALAEMASASALLAYVAPASRAPSGKLYEYLASGRPVLCVARDDGGAASLVRDLGAGITVHPDDIDGIETAVMSLWNAWLEQRLGISATVRATTLERFSRRRLTGDLAAVLNAVSVHG